VIEGMIVGQTKKPSNCRGCAFKRRANEQGAEI